MRLRFWMAGLLLGLMAAPLFAQPLIARKPALPWQTKGADGKIFRFSPEHLQRPAILLFWATWCPYCEALMPHLQNVADAAGKDKLDIYAIDIKDDGDPAATLRERKLTFTLVRDGDEIAERYGVKGTPGLFLVAANGDIVYSRTGGDAPEKVEAILREKLGLPPIGGN